MRRTLLLLIASVLIAGLILLIYDVSGVQVDGDNDYNSMDVIDQNIWKFHGDKEKIEKYLRRCMADDRFPTRFRGYLLSEGTRLEVDPSWVDQILMESLKGTMKTFQYHKGEIFIRYMDVVVNSKVYPARALLFALKNLNEIEENRIQGKNPADYLKVRISSCLLLEKRSILEILFRYSNILLPEKKSTPAGREYLLGLLSILIMRGEKGRANEQSVFMKFCTSYPDPIVQGMADIWLKKIR